MGYFCKVVHCRGSHAAVYQQGVVVTDCQENNIQLEFSREDLGGLPNAKLITPIAWKIPDPTIVNRCDGSPLSSGVTWGPSIRTAITMMSIPIRARPEARESLWISRYSESG